MILSANESAFHGSDWLEVVERLFEKLEALKLEGTVMKRHVAATG
jgi:hypothetical protein